MPDDLHLTQTELARMLAEIEPLPPEAYPVCSYNPEGDCLEITLIPESYWVPHPPVGGVSEHLSHGENKLVGFTIYGISRRDRKPDPTPG
jgi:hypothetical protein